MVVARRGAFVDDLAHDFQGGASMMKSTSDIERGFLQRAINAPRRRAGRAFAVVSAVPCRFRRKNGRRLSHDLLVECVWPHFVCPDGINDHPAAATDHFLGRPPFLPHCESLFLYLWVVAFPPFLPMHRGQIILVRGCTGQYVSLATAYFYLKTPLQSHPPAFFFLCRPACPSPTSTLCT